MQAVQKVVGLPAKTWLALEKAIPLSVLEPATLGLAALAAGGMLMRRRRGS